MNLEDEIAINYEVDKRNPVICRFTVNRTLYIGAADFNSSAEAEQSVVVKKLFAIEDIKRIQLIGHLLVVTKHGASTWKNIIERVKSTLEAHLISTFALSPEQVEDQMMLMGRDLKEKVRYLIDHKINPGIALHGGVVQLIDVKDNNVYIRLGGGCQGCAAADFTLQQGIEEIIHKQLPEIQQILDVTDHAAGLNPYYRPSK